MERYFAKRTEGDFSETQRIKAEVGHALLVRQAFAACMREYGVKDGRSFFVALRELLKELGKAGYTKQPNGWTVTGGKFATFEKMTPHQIFATWASVQQTIGKWIYNLVPTSGELWPIVLEQGLVFKANDVAAIMRLLFEFLHQYKGVFSVDTELGMHHLEGRMLACIQK